MTSIPPDPRAGSAHAGQPSETGSTWARALVASAFGLGLSPVLPGTCGALLGLGWHALLAFAAPSAFVLPGLALGLGASIALNQALTPFAVRRWRSEDPSQFVWDEVAGYLLTALLTGWLPFWPWAPLGFALFRVLDMLKVWPASWIDRHLHGASGILLDDLVSAVYAAALVHAARWAGV